MKNKKKNNNNPDNCNPSDKRYLRVVSKGTNPLKPSIESWDRVIQSGWFDKDENIEKYYKERWYPDLPDNVNSLEEFDDYIKDIADKAWHDKKKRKQALEIVANIEPYHLKNDRKLGLCLEADGVNVDPSQGIGYYQLHGSRVYELTGDNRGNNIQDDGIILGNPKICRKIK